MSFVIGAELFIASSSPWISGWAVVGGLEGLGFWLFAFYYVECLYQGVAHFDLCAEEWNALSCKHEIRARYNSPVVFKMSRRLVPHAEDFDGSGQDTPGAECIYVFGASKWRSLQGKGTWNM